MSKFIMNRISKYEDRQLLAIYNALSNRKVDRFLDRYTAEVRTSAVLSEHNLLPWTEKVDNCHSELSHDMFLYKPEHDPEFVKRNRSELGRIMLSDRIKLLVSHNPKRGLSWDRFECYRDGMLVFEWIDILSKKFGQDGRGKALLDLHNDSEKGYIRVVRTDENMKEV